VGPRNHVLDGSVSPTKGALLWATCRPMVTDLPHGWNTKFSIKINVVTGICENVCYFYLLIISVLIHK